MSEILIQTIISLIITLIGSVITYLISRNKNKSDIKSIELQCQNEIQKISIQIDKQAKLYNKNAQTDLTKKYIDDIINGKLDIDKLINRIDKLINRINKLINRINKLINRINKLPQFNLVQKIKPN